MEGKDDISKKLTMSLDDIIQQRKTTERKPRKNFPHRENRPQKRFNRGFEKQGQRRVDNTLQNMKLE